ncbi:hypothetical protein JL193_10360 [Polaribacter batillariae]|uniref:Addiction module component n=1 Tax=Polaribacter batillariae TaxID=2808900 RepID=A0ABX7SQN8_9FLAO|nr:hypothetical protein [Polaribacter batillariae]QTD36549.1 hypothetical protein JL193_10360 [Polaribacter batillariae]
MGSKEKRIALSQWILETDENVLNEIEAIYNLHSKKEENSSKIVGYTVNGKALTKETYVKHINKIRADIDNGAKTFTTSEVREYVLSNRNS